MTEPSLPHDERLIGLHVTARSARKSYDGVVLPPRPGSRSTRMRLALDDGRMVPLDPAWVITPHSSLMRDGRGRVLALTQRVAGRPSYRFSDLPPRHLATKTMLEREHRKQPAAGQPPLAWYRLPRDWAPLYAIADAEHLAPLSASREAAWVAARTCSRCGTQRARPLSLSPAPDSKRYCSTCRQKTAVERWIEASRRVQAEMSAWAREVLADPRTVLAASESAHIDSLSPPRYRVEAVDGEVLLDAYVRTATDERIATYQPDARKRLEGSIYVGDVLDKIRTISERRIITWYGGELDRLPSGLWENAGDDFPRTHTSPEDRVAERYRLWTGESPGGRYEWWYPAPKLPWSWTGSGEHERGYKTAQTAKDRVKWVRTYLERMANEQPPEPTARGV